MSDTTTPVLGLNKPTVGGAPDTWGYLENSNEDVLDAWAGSVNATLASLQAQINALLSSGGASAPGNSNSEAIGTTKWWPSDHSFPPGYVLMDGTVYATSQFPVLFGIVGYYWGGAGGTFAVPDMRGRIAVGLDAGAGVLGPSHYGTVPGGTGGQPEIVLTAAQMPPHNHGGSTDPIGDHSHGYVQEQFGWGFAISGSPAVQTGSANSQTDGAGAHGHTFQTDWQGGGAAHNNCQPGALGWWIIKAAAS